MSKLKQNKDFIQSFPLEKNLFFESLLDRSARLYPSTDERKKQLKLEIFLLLALSFLKEDEREILYERLGGKFEREIAADMKISRTYVSYKIKHAIKKLRKVFFEPPDISTDDTSVILRGPDFKKVEQLDKLEQENVDKNISKSIAKKVIDRDKECIMCGSINNLVVHRLCDSKPSSLDNCVAICKHCHYILHKIDTLTSEEVNKFGKLLKRVKH